MSGIVQPDATKYRHIRGGERTEELLDGDDLVCHFRGPGCIVYILALDDFGLQASLFRGVTNVKVRVGENGLSVEGPAVCGDEANQA